MQQYDLVALRSFVAVVETNSFKNAAELLDASNAAVSRRVSGLESALGVKLLNRTTRQIDLTEAGKQFYDDVVNVLQSLEEAEDRLQRGRETIKGTLRIAAPLSFGVNCISPILPDFMKRHAELNVQLQLDDGVTDLVAEGIDVSIRIGALKDSTLVASRIGSMDRIFCASPEYLTTHGEPDNPEQLSQHNCLFYSLANNREEWSFLKGKSGQEIALSGSLSANNGDVLRDSAIQGLGIALLPHFIVADALKDGRLQPILTQYSPDPYGLYALRPSRQFTPAKVTAIIDYLKTSFADSLA